ncbi:MAG: ribosome-associated translation inhibitor RaiA [Bacteroidota bacterium]
MTVQIHAPFEVNPGLQELITKKINKLKTFHDRIVGVDVFLKLEGPKSLDGKIVEMNMYLPGPDVFAKEMSTSYEKAIAATAEKLERQLKKRKAKLRAA